LLVYRGAVWPGRARQAVPRGRWVWRPPPPPPPARWGGRPARPAGGVIQGGGAECATGADGAPLLVYRGPKKRGRWGRWGMDGAAAAYRPLPHPLYPPQVGSVPLAH